MPALRGRDIAVEWRPYRLVDCSLKRSGGDKVEGAEVWQCGRQVLWGN